MIDRVLDANGVAAMLACSLSQVYAMEKAKQLPADFFLFEDGRGKRWYESTVERFLARRRVNALPVDDEPETPFVGIDFEIKRS